ncbi:MAG: replicative DNA helicase [Bacteroidales bacterium]|nr:replicative DNA helicase [Bacteroidales bacterium]
MNTDIDKTPPQAVDLEKAVLGAILLEKDALYIVRDKLTPNAFFKESHQKIYKAICDLDQDNEEIDVLTVQEKLGNDLSRIGGPVYLTQLMSSIATSSHIEHHSLIILQKYAARKMIRINYEAMNMAFDLNTDINETIGHINSGTEKIIETLTKGMGTPEFKDLVLQSLQDYEEREELAKQGKVSGIRTPILNLTKMTNGFQKGDLVVLAGRPSMGKTAMALQSIGEAIEDDHHPLLFSLEMTGVRLVDRILCMKANVSMERFRSGFLNSDEKDKIETAANNLLDKGITIDDTSGVTMEYIRSRAIIKQKNEQCDFIIIDYGQLVDASGMKFKSREQEVRYISQKSKQVAKDLNVPVILIMQLNRECEKRGGDKRPQLSDLRESGAIEQDADLVLLTYRPAYYGFGPEEVGYKDINSTENMGEIIVAKQRNGRVGTVKFRHNESITRIYDFDNHQQTEAQF